MINIEKLQQKDFGRWVIYKDYAGNEEKGKIKSWNDKVIFVVYSCNNEWYRFYDFTGCATAPKNLCFFEEEKPKKLKTLFDL